MKTKEQLKQELDSMISSYAYLVKVIEEQEKTINNLLEENNIMFELEPTGSYH